MNSRSVSIAFCRLIIILWISKINGQMLFIDYFLDETECPVKPFRLIDIMCSCLLFGNFVGLFSDYLTYIIRVDFGHFDSDCGWLFYQNLKIVLQR